jgi:hypothetical protein
LGRILRTKTLYYKLLEEEPDPLIWKPEEILITDYLKQSLVSTPELVGPTFPGEALPPIVNVDKGTAWESSPRNVERRNSL